jgi:hypothetical protein
VVTEPPDSSLFSGGRSVVAQTEGYLKCPCMTVAMLATSRR